MNWNEHYHNYIKKCLIVSNIFLLLVSSLVYSDTKIVYSAEDDFVNMDAITMRHIFTRKITKWSNGKEITVFTRPFDSIVHKNFVWEWFQLTNYKYKRLLKSRTYTGEESGVKIVSSDEEMLLKVSLTPFSIGYLSSLHTFAVRGNTKNVVILELGDI